MRERRERKRERKEWRGAKREKEGSELRRKRRIRNVFGAGNRTRIGGERGERGRFGVSALSRREYDSQETHCGRSVKLVHSEISMKYPPNPKGSLESERDPSRRERDGSEREKREFATFPLSHSQPSQRRKGGREGRRGGGERPDMDRESQSGLSRGCGLGSEREREKEGERRRRTKVLEEGHRKESVIATSHLRNEFHSRESQATFLAHNMDQSVLV